VPARHTTEWCLSQLQRRPSKAGKRAEVLEIIALALVVGKILFFMLRH
jgi:hypothetical protein